jgi:outer membrane protein OmpA-like peptidoglycan-associated protein
MKSSTQIDMPGDIEFQTGSSKIVMTDKSKKVLTQLAQILKDNPEITKLSVEGNTDNEGEEKGFDNVKLSQARADAVVDWLKKNGVDGGRLSSLGNGSKNPLAPNDSAEHKALNRRVEFHVRSFNGQSLESSSGGGSTPPAASSAAATPPPPASSAAPAKDATPKKKP